MFIKFTLYLDETFSLSLYKFGVNIINIFYTLTIHRHFNKKTSCFLHQEAKNKDKLNG